MSSIYADHVLAEARKSASYARMRLAIWRRERMNCQHPGCPGCDELDAAIAELDRLAGVPDITTERYP